MPKIAVSVDAYIMAFRIPLYRDLESSLEVSAVEGAEFYADSVDQTPEPGRRGLSECQVNAQCTEHFAHLWWETAAAAPADGKQQNSQFYHFLSSF